MKALQPCAALAAEGLARATRTPWNVAELSLGEEVGELAQDLRSSYGDDNYGVWMCGPGLTFMTLFPRKAGLMITDLFTMPYAAAADAVPKRERKALAEIANIAVNGFLKGFNETIPQKAPVSAPEIMVDSFEDILRRGLGRGGQGEQASQSCLIRLEAPKLGVTTFLFVFFDAKTFAKIK